MRKYTKRQAKIMYELLKKAVSKDFKIFWGEDTIELRSKKPDGGWKYEDGYKGYEGFKKDFVSYCKKRLGI